MSYKCKLCGTPQPAGTTMKKIVKMREVMNPATGYPRREVESETPVCAECYAKATEKALEEKFKTR
jgi:hypothetical protein